MSPPKDSGLGRYVRPQVQPVDIAIDLHGMRPSAAASATERHIASARAARLHIVKIGHGHGTGALKKTVHQLLKSSPLVKKFYLASHGDGGHGVTITELDYGQRGSYNAKANNSITPTPTRRK